jgi:hypothetical protein
MLSLRVHTACEVDLDYIPFQHSGKIFWLFGISRGKATYGGAPIKRIGDSPQGQGKGVRIEL